MKLLQLLLNLLTRFIWFALPGFESSTLGSVSSNPAFYHFTILAIWYLGKGKGWTSACYPFPEAILVQATTSTTTQSEQYLKNNSYSCKIIEGRLGKKNINYYILIGIGSALSGLYLTIFFTNPIFVS